MKNPLALLAPLILAATLAATAGEPKIQVVQLESLQINEGLITDEIVKRFDTQATSSNIAIQRQGVEDRIRGLFAAALAQQLSATKLLQLAVRDQSLQTLQKEWLVSEELGKSGPVDIGVENADYIATARIEDFVADRKVLGNERAAIWKNSMTASFEITNVATGTKKIITESAAAEGKGRRGVGGVAANYDARQIKDLCDEISNKLAARILDNISPPKVIAARGSKIIIDRGRAAGVKVGDKFRLIERVDESLGTDAGFPIGTATVEFVNEDTSNLTCDAPLDPAVDQNMITLSRIND
jgi:hypothetical protein